MMGFSSRQHCGCCIIQPLCDTRCYVGPLDDLLAGGIRLSCRGRPFHDGCLIISTAESFTSLFLDFSSLAGLRWKFGGGALCLVSTLF